MRLHLAGILGAYSIKDELPTLKYALESFYYWNDWERAYIPKFQKFMLDSGAFTFAINGKGVGKDFDSYVDKYIDFIRANDIELYIEMDIDALVGYDRVKQIRRYIENKVGKPSIPVYHVTRGMDEFDAMCRDYKYIALGTDKKIKRIITPATKRGIVERAHENGAQIHGLAETGTASFKCGFDSVDSTSWLSAGRYGSIPQYKNGQIKYMTNSKKRMTMPRKEVLQICIREWRKMQLYADKYL